MDRIILQRSDTSNKSGKKVLDLMPIETSEVIFEYFIVIYIELNFSDIHIFFSWHELNCLII